MKIENELEEQIKDHLKCYICLCQLTRPKMCIHCKRMCCEECINRWLQQHSFCGICKHQLGNNDLISIPFLDNMSSFFMENIEKPKKQINIKSEDSSNKNKIIKKDSKNIKGTIKINNYGKKEQNNNNIINNNKNPNHINRINDDIDNVRNIPFKTDIKNKSEINDGDIDICMEHGNNIEYYCIQCDKYFCGQCLIFFGNEVNKHDNHFIIRTSKLNDNRIKEVLNEYKKLSETNSKIDNLIGLCTSKIKENEIKKYEIIKSIHLIKDFYMNLIDKDSEEVENIIQHVRGLKNNFDINKNEALIKFGNSLSNQSETYKGIQEAYKDIKKLNVEPQLEKKIMENISLNQKNNPKLYLENYQSDFIEYTIPIPPDHHFLENQKLLNCNIPGSNLYLNIKYENNKVAISFSSTIKNTHLYAYIVFRVNKHGLEFIHLKENDFVLLDINKFLYLCDEENKIHFKFCLTKNIYN